MAELSQFSNSTSTDSGNSTTGHTPGPWHTGGTSYLNGQKDPRMNVWSRTLPGNQSGSILAKGVRPDDARLMAAAPDLLAALKKFCEAITLDPMPSYGAFHGGDPREFTPDEECSTDEERDAHRRDCAIWDSGGETSVPVSGMVGSTHVMRSAYGLGVYIYDDPETKELREIVYAAIAKAEGRAK